MAECYIGPRVRIRTLVKSVQNQVKTKKFSGKKRSKLSRDPKKVLTLVDTYQNNLKKFVESAEHLLILSKS